MLRSFGSEPWCRVLVGVVVICDPLVVRRPDHVVIGGRWRGPSVSDGGAGVPAGPGGWIRPGERSGGGGFTHPDRLWFIGPLPWSRPYTPTLVGPPNEAWGLRFQATRDCAAVGRSAGCSRSDPGVGGAGRTPGLLPVRVWDVAIVRISSAGRWVVADRAEVPVQPLQCPVGGVADDDDFSARHLSLRPPEANITKCGSSDTALKKL